MTIHHASSLDRQTEDPYPPPVTPHPPYPSILASIPSTFLAIYPGPKTGISMVPGSSPHPLPKDCIKAYSPRVPATFRLRPLSRSRACSCSRTETGPENFFYRVTSVYTDSVKIRVNVQKSPLQKSPLYVASRRNFSKIFSTIFRASPSAPVSWSPERFFQKIFPENFGTSSTPVS